MDYLDDIKKRNEEVFKKQNALFGNPELVKGRELPIGTITNGRKKVAKNKWVAAKKEGKKANGNVKGERIGHKDRSKETTHQLESLEKTPLSNQLVKLTGDGYSTVNWENKSGEGLNSFEGNIIVHKKTGLKVRLPFRETPSSEKEKVHLKVGQAYSTAERLLSGIPKEHAAQIIERYNATLDQADILTSWEVSRALDGIKTAAKKVNTNHSASKDRLLSTTAKFYFDNGYLDRGIEKGYSADDDLDFLMKGGERTGYYQDNATNKKAGVVGQKYSKDKKDEGGGDKKSTKPEGGEEGAVTGHDVGQLTHMKTLIESGDTTKAYEIYNTLPPEAQGKVPQDVVNKMVGDHHTEKDDKTWDEAGDPKNNKAIKDATDDEIRDLQGAGMFIGDAIDKVIESFKAGQKDQKEQKDKDDYGTGLKYLAALRKDLDVWAKGGDSKFFPNKDKEEKKGEGEKKRSAQDQKDIDELNQMSKDANDHVKREREKGRSLADIAGDVEAGAKPKKEKSKFKYSDDKKGFAESVSRARGVHDSLKEILGDEAGLKAMGYTKDQAQEKIAKIKSYLDGAKEHKASKKDSWNSDK